MHYSNILSALYGENISKCGIGNKTTMNALLLRSQCDFGHVYSMKCQPGNVITTIEKLVNAAVMRSGGAPMVIDVAIQCFEPDTISHDTRNEISQSIDLSINTMPRGWQIAHRMMICQGNVEEGEMEVFVAASYMKNRWHNREASTPFQKNVMEHASLIEAVRLEAHRMHALVNQYYNCRPYLTHLDMVADTAYRYAHEVCTNQHDILPLMFAAYFHDSIEDARLSYNDVRSEAHIFMDDEQTALAVETVYALTNDKGRSRSERAGDNYYSGIRTTPYAPFVKLCDRMANTTFSFENQSSRSTNMKETYRKEMPHFIESITAHSDDPRLSLPQTMVADLMNIING